MASLNLIKKQIDGRSSTYDGDFQQFVRDWIGEVDAEEHLQTLFTMMSGKAQEFIPGMKAKQ